MGKIITYKFNDNFLDKLAGYIDQEYISKGADLNRIAIVFGGRRPRLFIQRELAKRLKKSYFPPRYFTIDEFIKYTVRKNEPFGVPIDLDNCYLIYQLVASMKGSVLNKRETFAKFLPWSSEILGFIDQLDLENVDNRNLCNIEANAKIGYEVPADINQLLESIVSLRTDYHKEMKKRQMYSRGFQYLRASELIKDTKFEEFDQVLFCNFFYFGNSEEKIVKTLYDRDKATLIFQGDQRKWPVFKRIAKSFGKDIFEDDEVNLPEFNLKLYSGFDVHSQIGLVRGIVEKIENKDDTVIVLPNAENIVPLLSEIHDVIDRYNISVGYPLRRSSLYSLFKLMFRCQFSRKERKYYTNDYLKVLRHPFVKNFDLCEDSRVIRILVHKIEEILTGQHKTSLSGNIFIDPDELLALDAVYELTLDMTKRLGINSSKDEIHGALASIHDLMFKSWEDADSFERFSACLVGFLDIAVKKSFLKNFPLNINIASRMYDIGKELSTITFREELLGKDEIFRVFDSKVSKEIVAFSGSPLSGLQILGLFETRSLNFENVIVLDTNEGVLPNLRIHEPLIPREVKIGLGLDRLEVDEEIQRYQFMRLISSAKNVHLVYQESKEKEKSRFVEELVWEKQKKLNELKKIDVMHAGFNIKMNTVKRSVRKTRDIVEYLRNYTYSASSINTYLRNPLEFYYNYVLGLREKENLLLDPEARHVGTFIHELLEEAFKPFLGKKPIVDAKFKKYFLELFHKSFESKFEGSMGADSFLLRSVLEERLNRFILNEEVSDERRVDEILCLEKRFNDEIPLSGGNIKFKYIVDRIDKMQDGTIMLVDYKTGSIDQMPKAMGGIGSLSLSRQAIRETVVSFQVPLYYYLMTKEFKGHEVNVGLYNLRTLKISKFIKAGEMDPSMVNDNFLRPLDFIVAEILNPAIDFVEDESLLYH
ncbi:MAG: hypothetical protein A2243_01320 [Omnitrophica WOR_2 bacterium RIFOXYA2_FULL_38_17]|nr:MAG: hypothetical protein A2243_01320 [Omnitrophica WOR_2 bacterium RIFOXYA2_FULL_38_17]